MNLRNLKQMNENIEEFIQNIIKFNTSFESLTEAKVAYDKLINIADEYANKLNLNLYSKKTKLLKENKIEEIKEKFIYKAMDAEVFFDYNDLSIKIKLLESKETNIPEQILTISTDFYKSLNEAQKDFFLEKYKIVEQKAKNIIESTISIEKERIINWLMNSN